jgi:hypothetical protein
MPVNEDEAILIREPQPEMRLQFLDGAPPEGPAMCPVCESKRAANLFKTKPRAPTVCSDPRCSTLVPLAFIPCVQGNSWYSSVRSLLGGVPTGAWNASHGIADWDLKGSVDDAMPQPPHGADP